MKKSITALLLGFLITVCSASENNTSDNNNSNIKDKNITAPQLKKSIFTIQTLEGKEIHVDEAAGGLTFQEYKDKAVFLIFFGYRCPPCLAEMPDLIKLMEKKHPDLEIIAIEVQGLNKEKLKAFKKRKGLNYTLGIMKDNNKFINYIAQKAQWTGSIPFFIAFDKKGEVQMVHVGSLHTPQLDMIYKSVTK